MKGRIAPLFFASLLAIAWMGECLAQNTGGRFGIGGRSGRLEGWGLEGWDPLDWEGAVAFPAVRPAAIRVGPPQEPLLGLL
jgi:hypothetical protein